MVFSKILDHLDLNELGWRLVAPRIAFQKLMQAPRAKQFKIINVPADVTNTVNTLQRLPQETGTIKVQLKRRLQYKNSALSLNVRPYKVFQAAGWLTSNSTLYREQGVLFNKNWQNNFQKKLKSLIMKKNKIKILNKHTRTIWNAKMMNGVKAKQKFL